MGDSSIIAETPMGKISGRKCPLPKKAGAKQTIRYAKIPFAKPPVGDLRYEPPQKSGPWEGVRDGTTSAPWPIQPFEMIETLESFMCFMNDFDEDPREMSEDCLYLDVYTTTTDPNAKLPVLFWIYGGGFHIGSSRSYNGNILASLNDVVVVIPNYRVNILGLLSFSGDDSLCTGNQALLDQTMALEWVRDNVMSFGGNPDNVTIFGESAGAISVGCHISSSVSRDLFHRAISHSGVSDFPMMIRENNDAPMKKLMDELNIDSTNQKAAFAELKKAPIDKMMKVVAGMVKEMNYFAIIAKDGKFFGESPASVVEKKEFSRVPYIIGINNTEGKGIISPGRDQDLDFDGGLKEEDGMKLLKMTASMMGPPEKTDEITEALIKEYGGEKNQYYWSNLLGDLVGDSMFVTSSIKMAASHADASVDTYLYYMTHQTKYSHDAAYNKTGKLKSEICECDHSDDIHYTFGFPFSTGKFSQEVTFTQEEEKLSKLWMDYLVNFATTGDPNKGPHKLVACQWPKHDTKTRKYLEVNSSPAVKSDLCAKRMKFWSETFPSILQK